MTWKNRERLTPRINPIQWALKRTDFICHTLLWHLLSLPIGLAQSLPYSILTGPFLQLPLPATLYNPSESQHCYFSPEDRDSMLLWNNGFHQPVRTMPKPRSSPPPPWKPRILLLIILFSNTCNLCFLHRPHFTTIKKWL